MNSSGVRTRRLDGRRSALDDLHRDGLTPVALLTENCSYMRGRSPRTKLQAAIAASGQPVAAFDPRPSVGSAADRRAGSAAGAKPTPTFPYMTCACVVG